MASRYGITQDDLKRAALNLNMGEGTAARLGSADAILFIEQAETYVEAQISDFIGVPLKPTPAPGASTVSQPPTRYNFPQEFILAVIYSAVGRILHSEFFEAEPNVSQSGDFAEAEAQKHLMNFRSRPTVNVGNGRRRNPNPHMPPSLAPKETPDQSTPNFGMGQ
jgi:hypothetical protein